jgi:uncharacterized phage infection (PIP) family protein YhgE
MADNPQPSPAYHYQTREGKILYLESRQLYSLLLSLFSRLGGSTDTPDLGDLSEEVTSIKNQLETQQEQLSDLADDLISEVLMLQSQIDALPTTAVDEDKIYGILTDMNTALAATSDAAFQSI